MAEVSCRKVVKEYDAGVQAVKGIDLDIADHEFVVLVGPSGCGKSTTLRMIAGLEEITSGEIWIDGDVVNDVPPREPRHRHGVSELRALSTHECIRQHGVWAEATQISQGLKSSGAWMRQHGFWISCPCWSASRVRCPAASASALPWAERLCGNPKVFLFDEPLSNLDAKLRVQMRTEIKKVHQTVRTTTTVYVTHDQIEAMTLADRVVVMNGGVIEQVGTPNDLYHHPSTRFVAGFIGSPAMNFLPCRVQDGVNGGLAVRVTDSITVAIPPARADRYGAFKGREMVLGIRPEHLFEHHQQGKPGWARVDLLVDVVEPMGMETMVHFFVDGAPVCARIDPATHAAPGEMLPLTADLNQMHLMELDTGKVV